ncbi:cytochrome P450 [Coprinopsis sp. MPI-PUGE-AT-0042]|nr:cytochrome P450 [Coprinopsis sp. MPI-PUGE-AT-0042]
MAHFEPSIVQILGIPLCTVLIWATLKRVFSRRPFAMLPGPEGGTFLLGHMSKLFDPKGGFQFQERVVQERTQSDTLLVSDPKALHYILVKDQDVAWDEGENFLASNNALFGPGVISTHGHEHKRQRKVLNSVFSTNHIRNIASIFDENTLKLAETLSNIAGQEKKEVEVFDWVTRGALEIIGQGGFGYSFDTLSEHDKPHPFATSVKILLRLLNETIGAQLFIFPLVRKYNIGGKRIQRFVMRYLTWGSVRQIVDVVDVMHRTSLDIYEKRKQHLELEGEDGDRKDILSALMQANTSREDGDKMSDDEIIAQISTFAFAGMDTTSSALGRLLFLLSEKQDVQDRLRAEIREAKEEYGRPTYDQLMALPYLDAVCRETLRMYPPGPVAARIAKKDTVVPLLTPIKGTDGRDINEIFVPGGTDILVSLLGPNRSTKLWGPDAGEWKPERWMNELPKSLIDAKVPGIYSHLLTFAGGGRSCIGVKFAQLELKFMIFNLLDHLKFSPADKKIIWKFGGLVTPGVDPNTRRPELPLDLEQAKHSDGHYLLEFVDGGGEMEALLRIPDRAS